MTLETLIALLPILIPVGGFLYHLLVSKLPPSRAEQLAHLSNAIDTVVRGVEQEQGSGASGAVKKAAAVQAVNEIVAYFQKRGIVPAGVPVSLLDMLIEEAVFSLNQNAPAPVSLPANVGFVPAAPVSQSEAPQPGLMGFPLPSNPRYI